MKKIVPVFSLILILAGCYSCSITGEKNHTEQNITFQITDGACGQVIFKDNIGTDSSSAVETIRQRKVELFGESNFMIESATLKVEDEQGNVPEAEFYAIHILDEDSLHLHSVSEVITNEGSLYNLKWCAD